MRLVEVDLTVVEEVFSDKNRASCQFWHNTPVLCDQEPKYIGYLTTCTHPHLCCERHYQIFTNGRERLTECPCGNTGLTSQLDFVPL